MTTNPLIKKGFESLYSDKLSQENSVVLEKGTKAAEIGEVRVYSGIKYVKHENGWIRVKQDGTADIVQDKYGHTTSPNQEHHRHVKKYTEDSDLTDNIKDKDSDLESKDKKKSNTSTSSDSQTKTLTFKELYNAQVLLEKQITTTDHYLDSFVKTHRSDDNSYITLEAGAVSAGVEDHHNYDSRLKKDKVVQILHAALKDYDFTIKQRVKQVKDRNSTKKVDCFDIYLSKR